MNKFKIYIDPDIGYSVTDTNDEFIFATETKDKAKEIVSALEKQIPKKPDEDYCTVCNTYLKDDNGVEGDYCPNCGQRYDWRNEDE